MEVVLEMSDEDRYLLQFILSIGVGGAYHRLRPRVVDLVNRVDVAFKEAELRLGYDHQTHQ